MANISAIKLPNGNTYTLIDSTVPSWAKASSKPSYAYSEISDTPTLATVATSGSYVDLTNKPTITTYTAGTGIDITNDIVSLEDSGVTAGTYTGSSDSKAYGYNIPSFTIDSKGIITSASSFGTRIPVVTQSSDAINGGLIDAYSWGSALRTSTYSNAYTLSPPATTTNVTISIDTYGPYTLRNKFRVVGVTAWDATTYEPVIVDWSVDKEWSAGGAIVLTVSIADPYSSTINFVPVVTMYTPM